MRPIRVQVQVVKQDAELGILWGYASVAEIVDIQDDIVPWEELRKAVYQFMEDYYLGESAIRVNHEKAAQAVLVESTFHVHGGNPAWFVAVKLLDESLRESARKGEISGFSIGGYAEREIQDAQ